MCSRHEHRLDADGIVTLYRSFSGLARLPPDRLDAALADIRGVLDHHGYGDIALRDFGLLVGALCPSRLASAESKGAGTRTGR